MPSYRFYDILSVLSLGSLVISFVMGVSMAMGVAQSGGAWGGLDPTIAGWLSAAGLGSVVSFVALVFSCWGKQKTKQEMYLTTPQNL